MKVGTKMIGNWGAMIPLSYGVISKIDSNIVFITWDDMPGSISYGISDIDKGQMTLDGKPAGVGIYTEDQYYNN